MKISNMQNELFGDKATFSQVNSISSFCNKEQAKKFLANPETLYGELENLTSKEAHEVLALFHSWKGGQALLKLKSYGVGITIRPEDIKPSEPSRLKGEDV